MWALARARCGATIVGVTNEPERKPTTTTASANPAARDEHSLTVGPRDPTVLHDHRLVQTMQAAIAADDDFVQPRALYRDVMRQAHRDHLVSNVVANASDGVTADVQARVVDCWTEVDAEFGARVAAGLGREMRSAA